MELMTPGMSLISKKIVDGVKDKEKTVENFWLEEFGFHKDEINDCYTQNRLIIPMAMVKTLTEDMGECLKFLAENNFSFTVDPMSVNTDPIISNHYTIHKFFETVTDDRFNRNYIETKMKKHKEKILQ